MMSPRSRSADSRPPNSLVLARNCLAISFNPDPSRSSLPCKRCSGLEFIDDNEFSEKIKCQPMVITPSTVSTYSSPFTSLSPSEPESKSSSIQSAPSQQPTEEPSGKINCSSISTTLSDSSDSSSASSTSSTSTSSSPPSSPSSPSSSPPNYPCSCKSLTGLELFTSFVQQNYQCFWNPSLVSSVSTLNYTGFLLPSTILMIGSEYAYEVIRTAYARRILHPPLGYIIQSLGDVPLVEMSLVCQAKFTPLTEALCKCINDFNNRSTHVFLGDIAEAIKQSYPNIIPPTADMIKKTLRSLQRAGKVRFSTSEGYFLVKPTLTCESSILGTSLEPSSPCDTIKRESVKLYSSLMTPDEVISRLHGSPTSSTESAYFGSNGGVTLDTPNLMTPTSLNTTLNWDFGFNNVNGGTLLTDQSNSHEESDLLSLRRSSSLRVSTTVKGMNRSQENDDSEKPLTLSSTPNVPFSRSKSLRMVNNKEKIKSLTIDSSETTIKSEPITIVVKKPSIFTKFLARLSYNGGNGNNNIAPGTKLKSEGNRKLITNGMDQEINRPSQESKSTQTISKPSSPVVLHRQKSGKVYRLPAVGGFNGSLARKSSTLDSRLKCKPYGNLTSCMYCESLRTLSKSKRLNHAHQPMINNCCDLCSLIVKSNPSTPAVTASNEYNSRSFGLASVGPIVDPSCDKCISSLTYCCSNADCNISSPRLYSHYSSQHEHSSPYQLPNDHSNHHDSLHRQCLTLSSPTPSSSSPPPSPYSRFTLSPTLRPKTYFSPRLTSSSLGNNVSSTPLSYSPSSTLPFSSLTNSSPSTSTKTTTTTTINNSFEKLAPISIQTNADTAERLTLNDNLIKKTIPSLMTSQSPQKSLITTVGDLTNCHKLQEDQSLVIKGNPNDTSLSFITSGSTSNKNDSESFKISKDLAQDNLWNEIGGRQLEAELRETGITIGNSFNLKIEFGSPITTNQTKESTSSTTTSSSTTTLLSNGVAKSFTNFEEKSAENLPQNGFPPTTSSFPTSTPLPSPLSKSTSCNNQLVRPSLSSHMNGHSSANETSSVINSTSTVNVRTVTRTVGLNNEIECSNISPSSNNDHEQFTANYNHHDPGVKINQAFNASSSFDTTLSDNENESKVDEINKPTSIAITTTTKVTGALATSTADPHETVDSLGSNLIKKSTSISNIRQKVAQAKAAFFSSGDTGKITSAC